MRILIVSEFFYPYKTGTQKILTELAEDFVEYGADVSVLTTKCSCREEKQELTTREVYKGIKIKRIFSTDGNRDSKFWRIVNYLTFLISLFFNLLFNRNYEELLFVSNPPVAPFIGYIIKKIRGKQYSYLVHDVYPDVAVALGVIGEQGKVTKLMNWINNKIYNNAKKVIVLGSDMKDVIKSKGIEENKLRIVTNWADNKVTHKEIVQDDFKLKYGLKDKFNVLYTGNISEVHEIDTIVECAKQLSDKVDIQFTFVGDGKRKKQLLEMKEKGELSNVQILEYMYGEEYNNMLNSADVFITTLRSGIEGLGVPSKTYTYMSVYKPLIAIMNEKSEIGTMVKENKLGIQATGKEIDKIVDFILRVKDDNEYYENLSGNVKKIFDEHYERSKVTKKFYKEIITL